MIFIVSMCHLCQFLRIEFLKGRITVVSSSRQSLKGKFTQNPSGSKLVNILLNTLL